VCDVQVPPSPISKTARCGFQSSQASPACPSDKGDCNINVLWFIYGMILERLNSKC
jgi:hypothetical protein